MTISNSSYIFVEIEELKNKKNLKKFIREISIKIQNNNPEISKALSIRQALKIWKTNNEKNS